MASVPRTHLFSTYVARAVIKFVPCAGLVSLGRASPFIRSLISDLLKSDPTLRQDVDAVIKALIARVWVSVRAKPSEDGTAGCLHMEGKSIAIVKTQKLPSGSPRFFYDRVFDSSATQDDVWNGMAAKVMSCMRCREHACLLVYGQTGSGKTHTMFGDPSIQGGQGLAYRTVHALALMIQTAAVKGLSLQVEFTFVEVYNEKVYDLLNNQAPFGTQDRA